MSLPTSEALAPLPSRTATSSSSGPCPCWKPFPREQNKRGADRGIDGVIHFIDGSQRSAHKAVVQVKSGKVSSPLIRDLKGTVEREKAALGLFITLEDPTRDMRTEAVSAGFYHSRSLAARLSENTDTHHRRPAQRQHLRHPTAPIHVSSRPTSPPPRRQADHPRRGGLNSASMNLSPAGGETQRGGTAHSGNATKCNAMQQKWNFLLTPLRALCGEPNHTRNASGAGLMGRSCQSRGRVLSRFCRSSPRRCTLGV